MSVIFRVWMIGMVQHLGYTNRALLVRAILETICGLHSSNLELIGVRAFHMFSSARLSLIGMEKGLLLIGPVQQFRLSRKARTYLLKF